MCVTAGDRQGKKQSSYLLNRLARSCGDKGTGGTARFFPFEEEEEGSRSSSHTLPNDWPRASTCFGLLDEGHIVAILRIDR